MTSELKVVITAITVGFYLVYSGVSRLLKARKIKDHPRAKTRSVAQGLAELQGFAWALAATKLTNLSNQDAVFLRWELQESVRSGKSRRWVTKALEDSLQPFLLLDSMGAALVHPQASKLEVRPTTYPWQTLSESQQQRLQVFGKAVSGFPPRGYFASRRFRVLESSIAFGSPIYAFGEFMTQGSELERQVHARSGVADFLPRLAKAGNYMPGMDENKDGKLDEVELRRGFMKEAVRKHGVQKAKGIESEVLTTSGYLRASQSHELLLSDCHEDHLLERLGSWNLLRIVGGAASIALGISYFFSHHGF